MYFISDYILFPILFYVLRYRRRVVAENMRNAYPECSEKERIQMARAFYHHFADVIVEIFCGLFASDRWMDKHIHFIDLEDMMRDCKQAGGGIWMLGHLGCWEWVADYSRRIEKDGFKQWNVYRALKNKRMNRLMQRVRGKRGGGLIEKNDLIRQMIRNRKDTLVPCYGMLADQHPSVAKMWTEFLNQETAFLTGSEDLARKFNYPCYYVWITSPRRGYYEIRTTLLTGAAYAGQSYPITREYAACLQENINMAPEQWLWTHKRWKWKREQP